MCVHVEVLREKSVAVRGQTWFEKLGRARKGHLGLFRSCAIGVNLCRYPIGPASESGLPQQAQT